MYWYKYKRLKIAGHDSLLMSQSLLVKCSKMYNWELIYTPIDSSSKHMLSITIARILE